MTLFRLIKSKKTVLESSSEGDGESVLMKTIKINVRQNRRVGKNLLKIKFSLCSIEIPKINNA